MELADALLLVVAFFVLRRPLFAFSDWLGGLAVDAFNDLTK